MRSAHLPFILDPEALEPLTLETFETSGDHTVSGILSNQQSWYPIINGVPRMLTGKLRRHLFQTHQGFLKKYGNKLSTIALQEWKGAIDAIPDMNRFLKHQQKTAESFSYEWKHIYKENDYEKNNFFHFLSPYIKEADLRGKLTLDIGCGSGRFTKWAALSGSRVAFGSDLGETVEVAYAMTKDLSNACIVQADIYAMPFSRTFDIAYSIGVLHHLPKPEEGFRRLPKTLQLGGSLLIWVYNRRNNARALYFYEPLRSILKKLPKPLLFKLCYIPGAVVHAINAVGIFFTRIGLKKVSARLPFSYYAHFPFNMKLNDAFDVLATPKSNYYYRENIENWFHHAGLKNIRAYEHREAGITCVGTYDS